MTMLQLLKSKAEELLSDETKLQRCMTVGWTVEGPNALSPAWVYHSWDPSAKKQVVAETQPLAHAEALRQVDLLLHQDGALKNFKTARRMSAKDSYTAEVLPWMVSIGLRGESSNICYNALKMSGSAIMKLIGVRIRPERGQEPQLIKQDNVLRLGEEQCALEQRRLGRPTVTSGHYQTLLGMPADNDWTLYVCDDNRKPRKANNKDLALVDHNAYLVGLLRCP